MAVATLRISSPGMNRSEADLATIVGLHTKVVGIDTVRDRNYVHVSNRTDALYVIHELHGRFVSATDPTPLSVALCNARETCQASSRSTKLPGTRRQLLNLDSYIWRFAVTNTARIEHVLEFFRNLGSVLRWFHRADNQCGWVILKTTFHWRDIVARFNEATQGERRRKIHFDKVEGFAFPLDVEWCYGDQDTNRGYHLEKFFVGNLFAFSDARIRQHFKPWGEVVLITVHCKLEGFLILKTRYKSSEILRLMLPLVVNDRRLRVEKCRESSAFRDKVMFSMFALLCVSLYLFVIIHRISIPGFPMAK